VPGVACASDRLEAGIDEDRAPRVAKAAALGERDELVDSNAPGETGRKRSMALPYSPALE
jgi:hypothetical protein